LAEYVTLYTLEGQEVGTFSTKVAALLARSRNYRVGWPGPVPEPWDPPELPHRPLKLLAHVHRYPPVHWAGAEMMLHTLLRDMVARGHEAHVICAWGTPTGGRDLYQDVHLEPPSEPEASQWYRWADVVLTHLDLTAEVISKGATTGTPVVHLVHNDRQLGFHRVKPGDTALVVFNSSWLRALTPWPGRQIVVRPHVFAEDYRTRRGKKITLVSLTPTKGANLFYALAERYPERRFLGVKGAYGQQIVPKPVPRNVEIREHGTDMRAVYGATRLVLMPSDYESWGRVGVEASASGIPVLPHPTPGLQESLGDAGIFCDREEPDEWAAAIERLDDQAEYRQASKAASSRFEELELVMKSDHDLFAAAMAAIADERRAA
jgi:glycosyltransferase involved in cell wall biosynthesis